MNDETTPKWAQHGLRATPDALGELLSYARQNYVAHTDWYLRHRDAGIKLLSVTLIANVTIGGLYFDNKLPTALTILALVVLAVLSLALCFLATRSCRQAYSASLEHALLATKAAWAMGFAQPVNIPENVSLDNGCPANGDKSLYVPRYLRDAFEANSTEAFVETHRSKGGTTYFAARWILWILGFASCLMALSLIVAICIGLKCS